VAQSLSNLYLKEMIKTIKNAFNAYAISFRFGLIRNAEPFMRLGYQLFWKPKDDLDEAVDLVSKNADQFNFLQIGANDGMINDPIYKFILRDSWSGIRVEPLPTPFKKLSYLHGRNGRILPLQCLVADSSGEMELYHLAFSDSRWATGIASLDKSNLQRQIDNGYVEGRANKYGEELPVDKETWITSSTLRVLEINELISQNFQNGLDLLQIDVEGFDHKLIAALNFDVIKPKLIRFEHLHIPDNELSGCLDKLENAGYLIKKSDMDYLAILN
jgi:FkbM family methyltransferase